METPDYLAYKKNKEKYKTENSKMPKIKLFIWIFVMTFFGAFVGVKILAGQYTSKIDIEQEKNLRKDDYVDMQKDDERKYSIDKRLTNIYNEEVAPSKAKIIERSDDPSVIDMNSYREMVNTKKEDSEKEKEEVKIPDRLQANEENEKITLAPKIPLKTQSVQPKQEIPVYIRVFVGRYKTLNEAREAQVSINDTPQFSATSPFIRKIGEVYTIQIGSYTNKQVAKTTALKFGSAGYNVWMIEN